MKVLMILSNPFVRDPRVYNEAKSLTLANHKVTVLAWDRSGKYPLEETRDGTRIIRFRNTRLLNLMSYHIFRVHLWWRSGYKKAIRLFEDERFEIIHCHDLDTLPIGVLLKKKFKIPLIYDAHEIWGYKEKEHFPGWRYYMFLEKYLMKHVDQIITVNDALKDYFKSITDKPVTIVMNCKEFDHAQYSPPQYEDFTSIYIGGLTENRFVSGMIDAAEKKSDIRLIIAGDGEPDFVAKIADRCQRIPNVEFIGIVPFHAVLSETKRAHVVICMFNPENLNNRVGLPNKVFEAMVCGRPIIVTQGIFYERFVSREHPFGIPIPYDSEALCEALSDLKSDSKRCEALGRNALKMAEKYNWNIEKEKLMRIYERIGET